MKTLSVIILFITFIYIYVNMYKASPLTKDYQIEIKNKTGLLFDETRLVGKFKISGELENLIVKDNL